MNSLFKSPVYVKKNYIYIYTHTQNPLPCYHVSDVSGAQNTQVGLDLSAVSHFPAKSRISAAFDELHTPKQLSHPISGYASS